MPGNPPAPEFPTATIAPGSGTLDLITPVYAPPPVQNWNVGTTVVGADKLNKTGRSAAARQVTVAALDAAIPIPYGQVRLGALLANVLAYQGLWVMWVLWGEGPIDSFTSFSLNDATLPSDVIATHYTGAIGQGVDPTLAAAFAATPGMPAYTQTLPGIAYSVFQVKDKTFSGSPQFNAVLRGRKVYDPRLDSTNGGSGSQRLADSTTWAWSRNPALVLADFLKSTQYGDSKTLDWASVIAVANACDVTVGTAPNSEVKRYADFVVDQEQPTAQWIESLRTAACCWVVPQGDVVKLVADVAGSSVFTFDHNSGTVLAVTNEVLASARNLPTVMEVVYTDTTALPWRDMSAVAKRPGVDAGTTDWRKSTVRMPWITRSTQANREAIERLNKLWLRAFTLAVNCMDEGLAQEPGDVITLNFPDSGYSNLPVRVTKIAPTDDGWSMQCAKEDPGAYSTLVQAGPTVGNTNLPLPTNPPALTGLAAVEDVYQVQTGYFGSRLNVSWNAATWPFLAGYQVTVTQNGVVKDGPVTVSGTNYLSKQLTENLQYDVSVSVISTTASVGPPSTVSITNNGKSSLPSDVAILNGYDAGGEARLSWSPATDLDLTGYELRYGLTTDTWATATLLDRIASPTLRYSTKAVPPGLTRFFIKALDSVRSAAFPFGQASANAAFCDVTVSLDPDLFLAASYAWTTPGLTDMAAQGSTPQSWLTDYGTTWAVLFPQAMSTYTNPLASYFGSGVSTLLTETFDAGQVYSGLLTNSATWTDLSGVATVFLESSLDNVTFTQFAGQSAQVTGRYFRFRITTTGVVLVTSMGAMQLSVVATSETGSVLTSVAGWVTVTLAKKYAKVKTIQLTSDGSLGVANPVYDQNSITLVGDPRYVATGDIPEDYVDEAYVPFGSFAVECFDGDNHLIARSTNYLFQGI